MAGPLLLWLSRRSLVAFLRPFAAGAIPAVVLALYFTYSRGGIVVLVVAVALLLALSPDRLWMLGTVVVGALLRCPRSFTPTPTRRSPTTSPAGTPTRAWSRS